MSKQFRQTTWKSRVEAGAYLGAMWDGEGTIAIYYPESKNRQPNRVVTVCNTDRSIMDAVESALLYLGGMKYKRYTKPIGPNDGRRVAVEILNIQGRPSFEVFAQVVRIRCERKRDALAEILGSYKRAGPYRHRGSTECGRGHSMGNPVIANGYPKCRTCHNASMRARYWRLRGVDLG